MAVKEEAPQAVLTDAVGVRSSKGEILRAGVPIMCGEEIIEMMGQVGMKCFTSNLILSSADMCNCNKEFKMNGRQ